MKLSEAIRLGAMLRPQAFSASTRHGTCAVYAALDAIGQFNNRRYEFFPKIKKKKNLCGTNFLKGKTQKPLDMACRDVVWMPVLLIIL